MGMKRKGNPYYQAARTTTVRGHATTVYRRVPGGLTLPKPGAVTANAAQTSGRAPAPSIPAPAGRSSRWARTRAALRAVRAWYASVGVTPEPKNAKAPIERSKSERQAVRDRYDAWLLANGYDPHTGADASGFTPWGGHAALTQDPQSLRHPLTGKPWAPTGFLADGLHAATGTHYDQDGVDAKGFMKPDAEGRRIHVGTGTVFDLSRPPRTWDGDDEATHWDKHVSWRTPEVEAEIAESKRAHAEAVARIDEMTRIERKMQRMGLAKA